MELKITNPNSGIFQQTNQSMYNFSKKIAKIELKNESYKLFWEEDAQIILLKMA